MLCMGGYTLCMNDIIYTNDQVWETYHAGTELSWMSRVYSELRNEVYS